MKLAKLPWTTPKTQSRAEGAAGADGTDNIETQPNSGKGNQSQRPQWTGASAATTRLMTVGLWCLIAAGPLALGAQLTESSATPSAAPVTSTDAAASERVAAGAFAEDFITTWLTTPSGSENALETFVVDASSVTLADQPWPVSDATTAQVVEVADGLWSVTVAVTVDSAPLALAEATEEEGSTGELDQTDQGPVAGTLPGPVRRYFQVPVFYAEDGALRAQALPSPVPGPAVAEPARMDYRYRAVPTQPVATAAGEFLSALLTGANDVARYVSPGASITAVNPPPYALVEVQGVMVDQELPVAGDVPASGEQRHLLVTASATAGEKQTITVQYALTMTARDGRWEVEAIDPAPVLSDTAPPSPTKPPAPSESATTPSTTN